MFPHVNAQQRYKPLQPTRCHLVTDRSNELCWVLSWELAAMPAPIQTASMDKQADAQA